MLNPTEPKIGVTALRIGMFVARLDRPWLGTRFPIEGFLVRAEAELVEVQRLCRHVYVDLNRGEAPDPRFFVPETVASPEQEEIDALREETYGQTSELRDEITAATPVIENLSVRVADVMQDLRAGKNLDLDALKDGVTEMIESVMRNPDAFVLLIDLRRRDVYTYRHALGTSVWAATFGRHLGLPKMMIHDLALGGLLLDVGKSKLPLELLNRTDPLTEAELAQIRQHVQHSLEILDDAGGLVSDRVREMVATHHERHDGRGYPNGLEGLAIPLFGRIAGIVDTYDALTSARIYAKPISPHGAVNVLYEWRDLDYQKELVEQFIQVVGIYPTGTLVELSSGEVGVIISLNGARRLLPRVMIILDPDKKPYAEFREIDLRDIADASGEALTIRRGLPPGAYDVDPEDLFL